MQEPNLDFSLETYDFIFWIASPSARNDGKGGGRTGTMARWRKNGTRRPSGSLRGFARSNLTA